jgi:cobalt-zinc-cadmium efflux system outer membrane protein
VTSEITLLAPSQPETTRNINKLRMARLMQTSSHMPHRSTSRVSLTLLAAALLLSGTTAAQALAPLTRAEVLAQARERNLELKAARERLGLQEAELAQASQLLPSNPELEAELGGDQLLDNEGERSLGIGLAQEFEIAGQRGWRKAQAAAELKEAQARWAALEIQVARDASGAFLRLWRAERLRALARDALELNRTLEKASESRFQAGDIPELERNVVAVDVARAQREVSAAETEVVQAQWELARLLGRSDGARLTAADLPSSAPALPTLEQLKAHAREHRADLAAARFAEEAAKAQLRLRYRERVPNPTLRLGYEQERLRLSGPLPGGGSDLELGDASSAITASISIPLPLWNRQQGPIRAARAEEAAAAIEREAAERLVDTEVEAAFAAVERSRQALDAVTAALPKVDRNLELIRKGFEAGQVDLLELLNTRDRAQRTRQEYVETRVEYMRALDELMRATGQLPMEARQ